MQEKTGKPETENREDWKLYWEQQGQLWRSEPEINLSRQSVLSEIRSIKPNISQGIYPFKGIKLSRADIEWLLSTHVSRGIQGPVDLNDPSQFNRDGLDLRAAILNDLDLSGLPLTRLKGGLGGFRWPGGIEWREATVEQRLTAGIYLEGAILRYTRLDESVLCHAHLNNVVLVNAHLEGADLLDAHIEAINYSNLRLVYFDSNTKVEGLSLANNKGVGPRIVDIHWQNANISPASWSAVKILGDEWEASRPYTKNRDKKDRAQRIYDYQVAVRAYRQLATLLRAQGLNEEADRFTYRAHFLQRQVLRRQRNFSGFVGSVILDALAGYGYRPLRSFAWYLSIIVIFALAYSVLNPASEGIGAIVDSILSFHGRGLAPNSAFSSNSPITILSAAEAIIGFIIEISFIATFTQRYFGK